MTAVAYEKVRRQLEEYSKNTEWANQNADKLQEYLGEFVAIGEQKILGVAPDEEELKTKFGAVVGLYIEHVMKKGLLWIL